jgi:hypothetical protein
MGPTARLIEERQPAEALHRTISQEIAAAFAAAGSGPIRLQGTIFMVSARRPT